MASGQRTGWDAGLTGSPLLEAVEGGGQAARALLLPGPEGVPGAFLRGCLGPRGVVLENRIVLRMVSSGVMLFTKDTDLIPSL